MTINKITTVLLCTLTWLQVIASTGKVGNNISWQLEDNGVLSFYGTGQMKDFGNTPYRPQLVKTVIISDGITSVGANAFKNCVNLTTVTIPTSVKEIGNKAFYGCKSLISINIPYGVTTIGDEAFSNCILITDMDIPGSVKAIGKKAFADCRSLVKIRIPASVSTLGERAFSGCSYIERINELPDFLTSGIASRYSLSYSLVDRYWKSQNSDVATTAASAAPATTGLMPPKSTADNKKVKKPTAVVADVDISIPRVNVRNDKTFAVIVCNENYANMENVPFALNDGNVFRNYCEQTLGIPANNILHYCDATSGTMREILSDLRMANRIVGSEMKVIFYYSGHGAPDATTQEGCLIPVDARSVNPEVCLMLSKLYKSLGELDVAMTTVFLDACFSGGERNGGTLLADTGERRVKIANKSVEPTGRMVVFCATDGNQTALPYREKGHGIFTYFLLKKLKDSGGSSSLAELADYIKSNVSSVAFATNRQEQTPTVASSSLLNGVWQTHRLND